MNLIDQVKSIHSSVAKSEIKDKISLFIEELKTELQEKANLETSLNAKKAALDKLHNEKNQLQELYNKTKFVIGEDGKLIIDPEKLDTYKQAEQLADGQKLELEKIQKEYAEKFDKIKAEYATENEKLKLDLNNTKQEFVTFRVKNKLMGKIANQIKDEFPADMVVNLLSHEYDHEVGESGELFLFPKSGRLNIETNKDYTIEESLDVLRKGKFKGFFKEKGAPGGGAEGSDNLSLSNNKPTLESIKASMAANSIQTG